MATGTGTSGSVEGADSSAEMNTGVAGTEGDIGLTASWRGEVMSLTL